MRFRICRPDRTTESIDIPDETDCNKLYHTADCIRRGMTPPCTIETALPHAATVWAAQLSTDVRDFPAGLIREAKDDQGNTVTYASRLDSLLISAFGAGLLPAETGLADWTCGGETIRVPEIFPEGG